MLTELEALGNVGQVRVERSGPNSELGYEWTVTYLTFVGDVPTFSVGTDELTGNDASA